MTYKHITIQPKAYELDQLIDDTAPDGMTPLAHEIHAEATLAHAAPELLEALQALDDARMHTTIKPIGGKVMGVVAIPREVFDAAISAIARATAK